MSAPVALLSRRSGRLVALAPVDNCEACDEATREACEEYGCPHDTALDATGPAVGRSYLDIIDAEIERKRQQIDRIRTDQGLVAARMGATGRA